MEDEQASTETSQNEPKVEFKKPVLIGRIGKLPKKAKSDSDRPPEPKSEPKSTENAGDSSSKSNLPPAVLLKELSTPIPYKEPKWSGMCPDGSEYAFEVIKSGMIMEKIELTNKAYYVFGRLANCDVVMAHPTVSRHHAVLQYKAFATEGEPPSGWYLYDLGSTHGTFLNKERLKASHYTRVRVGHQIKFGNSSRTYIMLGPDFDCEGESELTVTEIKQRAENMKLERERMIQEAIQQREKDRLAEEKRREEQGIDWGMGEDAEEEPDLAENPYASTANEELYLEDPKKTLRGYYEREGHELVYDCEERGQGQFICRVELPIDDARGRPVMAEVIHRGKKKEAVIACALEACRILDRAGLLRQSKHGAGWQCPISVRVKETARVQTKFHDVSRALTEGKVCEFHIVEALQRLAHFLEACRILDRAGLLRQSKHESRRRKERDWSADDYYDSDDDNFLDRTGAVEKKRSIRMKKHSQQPDKPLTYDDLLKQISDIETKIAAEEKCLARLRENSKPVQQSGDEDALDVFMSSLSGRQSIAQKADISNAKMNIRKLQAELTKVQRLAEIARPAHLPPLIKKEEKTGNKMAVKLGINSVVYGKRIRLKEDAERRPKVRKEVKQEEKEFVEEMDSDEEDTKESRTEESQEKGEAKMEDDKSESEATTASSTSEKEEAPKKMYGPMRPPADYVIPENYFDQESDRDLPEIMEKE